MGISAAYIGVNLSSSLSSYLSAGNASSHQSGGSTHDNKDMGVVHSVSAVHPNHLTYSFHKLPASSILPLGQQKQIDLHILQKLSTLDTEVRSHEQAHAILGGQYTSAPSYEYEKGPNGVNYAVSGDVFFDTTPVKDNPLAAIEKAGTIRKAALAPSEPSADDYHIAAAATQVLVDARLALLVNKQNVYSHQIRSYQLNEQLKE